MKVAIVQNRPEFGKVQDNLNRIEEMLVGKSADLFVMPSIIETFGMVLIEAMAAGLPIITTDAPGCRETVALAAGPRDQRIQCPGHGNPARSRPEMDAGPDTSLRTDGDFRPQPTRRAGNNIRQRAGGDRDFRRSPGLVPPQWHRPVRSRLPPAPLR